MMVFVQKLLEWSMRMDASRWALVRLLGKITGVFPVWYSGRVEKKLFREDGARVKKRRKRKPPQY